MESQIIDYYNEMPSGINVIDKMNEELNELQSENKKLIESLKSHEVPHPFYSCMQAWNNTRDSAYKNIKEGVEKLIVSDEFEYRFMGSMGLCIRQRFCIHDHIEKSLNIILRKSNPNVNDGEFSSWVSLTTHQIIFGIEGFIHSLMEINLGDEKLWDMIYRTTSPQQMADMIYRNIVWQLDQGILDGVPMFKCSKCGANDDWVNDDTECYECSRPECNTTTDEENED
tara:strand:+ start:847 stop:1527 length:681 start_codon:yes stop_codon:yes gene_type:complete